VTERLQNMNVRFFVGEGTETLLHDILDARFKSRRKRERLMILELKCARWITRAAF